MSDRTLRVGIIGCGGIARSHADGWTKNGGLVTAVTDVRAEAMDEFVRDVAGDAETFQDALHLIDSGKVDVVSVCTPPVAHAESVVRALQNGLHVLCEKPLAESVERAREIAQAAEQSSAKCMTAFRHRFLPAVVALKQMLAADAVGAVVFFHNRFYGPALHMKDKWFTKKAVAGGGCMLDTSSHAVDLFRYLVGEPVEASAVMHRHFDDTDVEDAAILLLKSDTGALGSLASGFVAGDGAAFIDVVGREGRLLYDYLQPDVLKHKQRGGDGWETTPVQPSNGFVEQIAAFHRAILDDREPPVTARDGLRCLDIIFNAYDSGSASL
jgi:predicted dehydrogenase